MEPRERRIAWWIALGVLAALLPGAFFCLLPERGKSADGAWRVLCGDTPYRDFWTMYAPGAPALHAWLLRLFGRELVVQAIAVSVLRAATAGLAFVVARRMEVPRRFALALALVLGLSSFQVTPELSSYPPALLLCLGATWGVLLWLEEGWDRRLWHAGLLLGLAALFKHDVAAYWTLGTIVAVGATWLLSGRRRPKAWTHALRASWLVGAGAAVAVLPVAITIAWTAGADAWRDLVVFPATDFRLVRTEPFPWLAPDLAPLSAWLTDLGDLGRARDAGVATSSWMLCLAPQATFAASVVFLVLRGRRLPPERLGALLLPLALLPLFWIAAHVQQNTHLTSMGLLSLLLLGSMAGQLTSTRPLATRVLLALALFQGAGLLVRPAMEAVLLLRCATSSVPLDLPGAALVRVRPEVRAELAPVVDFVRAHTTPRERIHVGVRFHDAVVISNPRFHWLCERRAATRYSELHPGVTDRAAVQREMIRDLEGKHVRCLVLWRFGRQTEEDARRIAGERRALFDDAGSGLLDAWIAERFEPVLASGEVEVWWRRDAPPPRALGEGR